MNIIVKPCPVVIPYAKLSIRKLPVAFIVVHCAATNPEKRVTATDIHNMHLKRGFSCIGYHYFIDQDGVVTKGRPDEYIGAHVEGHNSNTLGICLEGGVDSKGKACNNYTSKQFSSLRTLLNELKVKNTKADVCGHRDLSPDKNKDGKVTPNEWLKDCPCFNVREWYSGKK